MQSSFLGTSSGLRAGRAFAPSRVSVAAPTVVAHYGGKANLGGGKPWERTQTNHNGKPVKIDMHVKKGDIVQVRIQWPQNDTGDLTVLLLDVHGCNCSRPSSHQQGQGVLIDGCEAYQHLGVS